MVVWKKILMSKNIVLLTKIFKFAIFFIAIQAIITPAIAVNSWIGIVTHVTDGDTLWIRPTEQTDHAKPRKIRIDGIDAPEFCQLYGKQSTAALKKFASSKTVVVTHKRFDDYGREVSKISINNADIGAWMVSNGHAWSYHYKFSAGPYRIEEESAQRAKLGLFADATAIEPRIFRKEHGSCYPANRASPKSLTNQRFERKRDN
jgi:endonuclease YncB( thermonuclease family)